MSQRLHFIAIGGAAMHNLALALQRNGHRISGSDDEIQEPSLSRLKEAGLLPLQEGWYPEKISSDIDGVILGMHARADNPELIRAQELKIPVYSFPEYLYEHSRNKKRIVIGGSHGKTTITSMILHVLQAQKFDFDYMVGAKLEGFETMVRLSNAPLIVLEGDEYLASPVDRRPKFHLFQASIGLISGIAWDHINVFPEYENYAEQFRIFADNLPADGRLIFCENDSEVVRIVGKSNTKAKQFPYGLPRFEIQNGKTYVFLNNLRFPLSVFGEHNLMNLEGARLVCEALGIDSETFYSSVGNFKGASRRLEMLADNGQIAIFRDFAHSPSKLEATLKAVRNQYPGRRLFAIMELHTFSSLNENFLEQYAGTMDAADVAYVYFNPLTIEHKNLKPISGEMVREAFANKNVEVMTDSHQLKEAIIKQVSANSVVLFMSSGSFDRMDMDEIIRKLNGNRSMAGSV